jgi:hypothetical protein
MSEGDSTTEQKREQHEMHSSRDKSNSSGKSAFRFEEGKNEADETSQTAKPIESLSHKDPNQTAHVAG